MKDWITVLCKHCGKPLGKVDLCNDKWERNVPVCEHMECAAKQRNETMFKNHDCVKCECCSSRCLKFAAEAIRAAMFEKHARA